MDFKDHFQGKAVVITGAAGLFGRGLAQTFAAADARLCVTERDQGALDALLDELNAPGLIAVAADLTSTPDLQALIAAVGQAGGAPDIVINNDAIYPSHFLLNMQIEDWDRMMDVNSRAPFVLMQSFAKMMIAAGHKGSFVNIGSGASRKMRMTAAAYCISKTSLERLTKGDGAIRHPRERAGAGLQRRILGQQIDTGTYQPRDPRHSLGAHHQHG